MPPENTQPLVQPTMPQVPLQIGKFKASVLIAKQSWAILKQDTELLWFPVLSSIISFIAFVIMASVIYFSLLNGNIHNLDAVGKEDGATVVYYIVLFIYYLVTFFIINFFQSGMLVIASARFKGQDATFNDGMNEAKHNVGKLFMWSMVSATVGVILNIIANNFKLVGRIVAYILGAAWNILTYFSLPALIIGKNSIRGSFKESAMIIRKTWGETIIVNLGMSLFFGVIILLAFIMGIGILVLAPSMTTGIIIGGIFLLFAMGVSILSSTLGTIFKLALYEYARTGTIVQGFSPELVQNAVKSK